MVEEKNKKYLLLSLKGEKNLKSALHLAKLRTKVIDSHRQRFRFLRHLICKRHALVVTFHGLIGLGYMHVYI